MGRYGGFRAFDWESPWNGPDVCFHEDVESRYCGNGGGERRLGQGRVETVIEVEEMDDSDEESVKAEAGTGLETEASTVKGETESVEPTEIRSKEEEEVEEVDSKSMEDVELDQPGLQTVETYDEDHNCDHVECHLAGKSATLSQLPGVSSDTLTPSPHPTLFDPAVRARFQNHLGMLNGWLQDPFHFCFQGGMATIVCQAAQRIEFAFENPELAYPESGSLDSQTRVGLLDESCSMPEHSPYLEELREDAGSLFGEYRCRQPPPPPRRRDTRHSHMMSYNNSQQTSSGKDNRSARDALDRPERWEFLAAEHGRVGQFYNYAGTTHREWEQHPSIDCMHEDLGTF
jgi:hypothetical protein